MLALAAATAVPLRQYFRQQAEIAALERKVEALKDQRAVLEQRIERLHDPEYVELLARRCLGMVKKGEIAFVTVSKHGEPLPPDC